MTPEQAKNIYNTKVAVESKIVSDALIDAFKRHAYTVDLSKPFSLLLTAEYDPLTGNRSAISDAAESLMKEWFTSHGWSNVRFANWSVDLSFTQVTVYVETEVKTNVKSEFVINDFSSAKKIVQELFYELEKE